MQDVSNQGGRTVLFVSHNLGAVASLTQKCAYLKKGQLMAYDRTPSVIRAYTGDHRNISGEWKAPQPNQHPLQITSMKLTTHHGQSASEFELGQDIWAEIEYVVRERMRNTVVEIMVFSGEGTKLIVAGDYDNRPELLEQREPGHYRAKIALHGQHLNIGNYSVILNSCAHGMHTYDYVEAGAFTIVERSGMSYHGQRGGVLAHTPRSEVTKIKA
jgi:lipopolysaccharide transport system ATP-binding protein